MAPLSPAGIPWNDGFTWLAVNYAPIAVLGTLLLRRRLVAGLGQKVVQGTDRPGHAEELARIEAQFEGGTSAAAPSA